jgi:hypothetical protein
MHDFSGDKLGRTSVMASLARGDRATVNVDNSVPDRPTRAPRERAAAALQLFGVLATHRQLCSPRLDWFEVPGWIGPAFSPILLGSSIDVHSEALAEVEHWFAATIPRNKGGIASPYINFFNEPGLLDVRSLARQLAIWGWSWDAALITLEFIRQPPPIPPGHTSSVKVGPTLEKAIWQRLRVLLEINFGATAANYSEHVHQLLTDALARSYTIWIEEAGKMVAAAILNLRGPIAFLAWGSVLPQFRQQGLNKVLLRGCYDLARQHGAIECAFATKNPLLQRRQDEFLEMVTYRKK